jgi:hypothetical protein
MNPGYGKKVGIDIDITGNVKIHQSAHSSCHAAGGIMNSTNLGRTDNESVQVSEGPLLLLTPFDPLPFNTDGERPEDFVGSKPILVLCNRRVKNG